ncbi:glycosyltransferase family 25 protein [Proteus terrae]|uniref:glycosyltransferase family 25 protein n=1 Tax=Proteus terrae TaxID=1574161 RepID=UPI0034D56B89
MNNFVISLSKNNEKRRLHIKEQFSQKSIPFEFFDAVDKTKLNIANELGINFGISTLTDNEKGCFLSHVSLWKKVVDEDISVIGIFEDDIYLSREAGKFLSNYEWVDPDWHVVKIERADEKVKTSIFKLKTVQDSGDVFRLKDEHLCAGGYIITNKGARFLLNKMNKYLITEPIDYEIFDNYIIDNNYIVCQFIPALCIQDFTLNKSYDNFPSSLFEGRIIKDKNHPKTVNNKLLRELSRVKNQLINLIFKKQKERKLPFNI